MQLMGRTISVALFIFRPVLMGSENLHQCGVRSKGLTGITDIYRLEVFVEKCNLHAWKVGPFTLG